MVGTVRQAAPCTSSWAAQRAAFLHTEDLSHIHLCFSTASMWLASIPVSAQRQKASQQSNSRGAASTILIDGTSSKKTLDLFWSEMSVTNMTITLVCGRVCWVLNWGRVFYVYLNLNQTWKTQGWGDWIYVTAFFWEVIHLQNYAIKCSYSLNVRISISGTLENLHQAR